MEYNVLKICFYLMSTVIVIMGSLINFAEQYLPTFITQTFRYGKHAAKGPKNDSSLFKPIKLPKRWFRHFYLFAASYTAFVMVLATNVYFYQGSIRSWMVTTLDLLLSSSRKADVSAPSAFLALSLITLQAWHRFYETWFVSIYSDGLIDVTHYLVGYFHYFGAVAVIIAEAPGFIDISGYKGTFSLSALGPLDVIGTVLFVWACYLQFQSAIMLANLRKDQRGKVVTRKHMIPKGGWFELISSPHLFSEVVMYFALTLVLWGSQTWHAVFVWVFCNQVEVAMLTHWWYKDTFKQYPKARKAIFPYIL